jgi:hypothetical protein
MDRLVRVGLLVMVHLAGFGIELVRTGDMLSREVSGLGGLTYVGIAFIAFVFAVLIGLSAVGVGLPLVVADVLYGARALSAAPDESTYLFGLPGIAVAALFFVGAVLAWNVRGLPETRRRAHLLRIARNANASADALASAGHDLAGLPHQLAPQALFSLRPEAYRAYEAAADKRRLVESDPGPPRLT